MMRDPRGIPVTTDDPHAVDALEAATMSVLGHRADAAQRFADVVAADPEMVAGRAFRGWGFALLGRRECIACARDELGAARQGLAARGGSRRERLLVTALGRFVDGEQAQAMAALEAILEDEPRDVVAAKLAHAGWFVLGRSWAMRRVTERVLPRLDPDVPGYGHLLGCHGFALEETGDYGPGEAAARRAVELDPSDLWAGHAVGHVLEMEGRVKEGIAWLRSLGRHMAPCNNLRFHVHWHEALFHLALGDHETVLSLYDHAVRAEPTDDYRDHSNGATLLWRLEREGIDVGDRWTELADVAAARADDDTLGFAVVHYGLALVGAGRIGEARRLSGRLSDGPGDGPGVARTQTQERLLRELTQPVIDAFIAFAEGRPADSVATLHPIRHRVVHLGGSHAQRDVFTQFLVDAALAAGDGGVAREVLNERGRARGQNAWDDARRAAAGALGVPPPKAVGLG